MEVPATKQSVGSGLSTDMGLARINAQVITCRLCPRLVEYREDVARKRRKEFLDWVYWGKPVPGFGDLQACLLIVGLAPAAHGGNRTGRPFTGDRSGDFLFSALHKVGFANQALSRNRDDGLRLNSVYVTAAVKCAPPENKPTKGETLACSSYLEAEIDSLPQMRSILCLGQFAFNSVLRTIRKKYDLREFHPKFGHGRVFSPSPESPVIFCSYHPSPRNTQTGKLTEYMFMSLLKKIQRRMKTQRN